MSKLIVSEFMSLDGVVEEPAWTMPYWSDEIARFKDEELRDVEALVLGRVTYEGFAAAWPGRTDEDGYADKMNSMPKFVATTTLDELEWNNSTPISENIAQEIARLKEVPDRDLLIFGSGTLVNSLMREGLIDEYRLLVYPVVLGSGKRLFADDTAAKLRLVSSNTFGTGVTALIYQPDTEA